MQFIKKIFFLSAFTLFVSLLTAQSATEGVDKSYRFVFYNVENYFDAEVDSLSNYREFEPDGMRHWTYSKYRDKRNKIYQVIAALGGWQLVTFVALAEIENKFVLDDLIESTPLKNEKYEIIHTDSKDERGIDVGIIYLPDIFTPLTIKNIPVIFKFDTANKTRDILYVKGLLENDTLHVFVNHWPSRYGGMLETTALRMTAATTLNKVCDSICRLNSGANILLIGDFNDDKENESMQFLTGQSGCGFVNLPFEYTGNKVSGTLKYQGIWNVFDQLLVSDYLFSGKGRLKIKNLHGNVFDAPFLLEEDRNHSGLKPYRTFSGYKFNGGFSDHLPVFVDIYSHKSK